MLIELPTLATFAAASLVLIVAPGPDIVFLLTQSLTQGRKAGFATALGLSLGNLFHTALAAFGIAVLIQTNPWLFNALKLAGAGYLLWLAWQAIKHRQAKLAAAESVTLPPLALFQRGLLMNLLNPKVALFFLAFLPQFVNPEQGQVPVQMLSLGLLFTGLTLITFGAISQLAAWLRQRWLQPGSSNTASAWLVAGIFAALAVKLLFAEL